MSQASTRTNSSGWGSSARQAVWVCLVCADAGCHVPPAPPADAAGRGDQHRKVVLTKQLLEDAATQAAARPLRTGAGLACGALAGLCCAGEELVGRRVLLTLAGHPGPLACDRLALDPGCLEAEL